MADEDVEKTETDQEASPEGGEDATPPTEGTEEAAQEGSDKGPEGDEAEGDLSLAELDGLLAAEDPEFQKQMQEISEDEALQSAEVEEEVEEESETQEEPELEQKKSFVSKLRSFVATRIYRFKENVGRITSWSKRFALSAKTNGLKFVKTDLPVYIAKVTQKLKAVIHYIKYILSLFKNQSRTRKLMFLFLVAAFSGAIYLFKLNLKGRWLPYLSPPLVKSLLEKGQRLKMTGPERYMSLDLAFPEPAFTVLMKRITVNLTPTRGFANPLASFQFYVDADTQDTAIELRHRDNELSDYISRELEGFTYPEITSARGREKVKNKVRETVNQALNRGRVREIYAKTYEARP